jgi:predicted outer membrane lipoprotein
LIYLHTVLTDELRLNSSWFELVDAKDERRLNSPWYEIVDAVDERRLRSVVGGGGAAAVGQ